jgi:hypothetical protein
MHEHGEASASVGQQGWMEIGNVHHAIQMGESQTN